MDHLELPRVPSPQEAESREKSRIRPAQPLDDTHIVITKARVRDVQEILDLVNGYAAAELMLPRGPQYLYENIRDFVIAGDHNAPAYSMVETRKLLPQIVACGSLHVLWDNIAEIRALAIHPDYQHLGLGTEMVETMIKEAKQLGIKRLYTFTLTEDFFASLGFKGQLREELPSKMWGECSRCPKYFKCDEVGMAREL